MASSMSDQKFIKSFSIFLVLGVVLTLFLILLGNLNAGTITDQVREERNAMAEASDKSALQPVGQISVAGDEAAQAETVQVAAAAIDGAGVYQSACMACHAAGIAGAPRVGDAGAWAERIAENAPLAVAASKALVQAAARGIDEDQLWEMQAPLMKEVFSSNDAKEGPAAFAEKRAPRWTGT